MSRGRTKLIKTMMRERSARLTNRFRLVPGLILLSSMGWLNAADLRVDVAGPGKKVNPQLFGMFLEEINHAGDGGLYAELIRNGSFTESSTLDGWSTVRDGSATVNVFFDTGLPLNSVKPRSLRVEIGQASGQKAGIANEGYWGIAVHQGASYKFSAYARGTTNFTGPLTVALEGNDGTVYGQAQIDGLKPAWNRFSVSLASSGTDPAAHLTITSAGSGTFWLNMVSLRSGEDPFRADLLEKLKDLKPGFLRFPGGTYVQGNDRASAWRWKNTIGPLEMRPGHRDAPWSYWSTDSMGYHEYLLLCERLGAIPMFVAYAGMTWTPNSGGAFPVLKQHKIPVSDYPMDEMGPIVQDALDAIEYANGPVTSTWGALRAKAGHPAPFGLRYIEIGNEDGNNALYPERYMLFYKAIKARFPEVQVIANARRVAGEPLPMDLLDEHTYGRPLAAMDMGKRLDSRDRKGTKSVLAEYAVQTASGFGNMREALAEAVMLSGIERNSDVMPLASFAPLLANVHAINWRPNLIYFDSASSYGTPSYYVQKMFADSRLDQTLPVQVNAPEMKVNMEGDVNPEGFGAQAEFQDAKVTGSGADYTYSLRARKTSGDGGFMIRFASNDNGGSYLAWFLGVKHRNATLEVWGGGGPTDVPMHALESSFSGPLGPAVPGSIETGAWYNIKIHVEGRRVHCYLDDKEIHDVEVPESLGASVHGSAGRTPGGEIVVRLMNASPVKQKVSVELAGSNAPRYSATVTDLASKNLDEENSVAEPTRISPREHKLGDLGARFEYELEGNSFTVVKLTANSPGVVR
ncbi:MAG: alpha-L-arabinofuranosidase C-terminal domain-containing protein [Bryobacteraceae bacterium]